MCRGCRSYIDRPVTKKSGAFAIPWQDFPLHLLAAIPAVCTAFSLAGSPYENARITFADSNTCQSCLKNWAGIRDFRSGGYFKCRAYFRPGITEGPGAPVSLATQWASAVVLFRRAGLLREVPGAAGGRSRTCCGSCCRSCCGSCCPQICTTFRRPRNLPPRHTGGSPIPGCPKRCRNAPEERQQAAARSRAAPPWCADVCRCRRLGAEATGSRGTWSRGLEAEAPGSRSAPLTAAQGACTRATPAAPPSLAVQSGAEMQQK